MVVNLVSFGYKHGVPVDADLVFDVRCLPNPHFVDRLRAADRPRSRRSSATCAGTRRRSEFIDRLTSFLEFALPHYVQEGKSYLTVAIGCTGGRHRSVMIAEALKKIARRTSRACALRVKHRDQLTSMIGVVVVTHGQLATELVNAAETIVGDLPRFAAVSIGWHEDTQDAREEIAQAIARVQQGQGVLILTDMFGGTPSNLAMTFLGRRTRSR